MGKTLGKNLHFYVKKKVKSFPKIFLAERFDIFPIENLMEKHIIIPN